MPVRTPQDQYGLNCSILTALGSCHNPSWIAGSQPDPIQQETRMPTYTCFTSQGKLKPEQKKELADWLATVYREVFGLQRYMTQVIFDELATDDRSSASRTTMRLSGSLTTLLTGWADRLLPTTSNAANVSPGISIPAWCSSTRRAGPRPNCPLAASKTRVTAASFPISA